MGKRVLSSWARELKLSQVWTAELGAWMASSLPHRLTFAPINPGQPATISNENPLTRSGRHARRYVRQRINSS
jgi:hypothetical protein